MIMPLDGVHYVSSLAWCEAICGDPLATRVTLKASEATCPACVRALRQATLPMPESALLKAVRAAASARGFLCYHTHRSDRSDKGWFDVALAKPGHPLYLAELKTATGKLTMDQHRWQTTVAQCTGVAVHIWRPADLPAILALLKEKTR